MEQSERGLPLLEVERLSKAYGCLQAVDHISFQLWPGELVALLGENGAGKTTTLQMLAGLLTPSEGSIYLRGQRLTADELKSLVGYMPEMPTLYPGLTGQEFLEFVGGLRGFSRASCRERASELLVRFGLEEVAQRRIRAYSQGMKRRLVLCATLLHQPPLLLLDEPLNGIDPSGVMLVKRELATLSAQGHALLIATHLLDVAERLCGRAIILGRGRIVADGSLDELRARAGESTLEQIFARLALASSAETMREEGR
uniref:ABC transporter ATP-binding protein n=1 Tax=Thermogemmatispora argillosa TaxID=2045280 RepID=A0A455T0U4_9CHLR|nr:ABC transporter ATP-binding protein [Thermogemmatispora argillosa]